MKSFTGRLYDPMNLRPEDININDICHHLSHIGRFGGATRFHYSVGQHSCLITRLHCQCLEGRQTHRKQRFAHDFGEAYLGDVPSPLKYLPEFEFYRTAEKRAEEIIFGVLGLPATLPPCVKEADNAMLVREGIELMNHDYSQEYGPAAPVEIEPWTPERTRDEFMAIYRNLFLN